MKTDTSRRAVLRDPLRAPMNARLPAAAAIALYALAAALYGLLVYTRMAELVGAGVIALTAAFCLLALLWSTRRRAQDQPLMTLLCLVLLCGLCVSAHLALLTVRPGRMTRVLQPLLDTLWNYELPVAMAWEEDAWSGGYLIVMALFSRMEVFPALYAVKLLDLAALTLAAAAVGRMACRRGAGLPGIAAAQSAAMLLPTMLLNAGLWAQCDAVFAAFSLWGLALLLEDKPLGGCLLWGCALAFKLQAAMLFPLLAVLFMRRRLGLRHIAALALAFLCFHLPMLLQGQGLSAVLGRYHEQRLIAAYGADSGEEEEPTEDAAWMDEGAVPEEAADVAQEEAQESVPTHEGLADHAASVYSLMTIASVREFSGMGQYLAFAAALLVVFAMLRGRGAADADTLLTAALLLASGLPLVLPQANARMYYLAGLLSLTRVNSRLRLCEAALLETVSLCCYVEAIFSTEEELSTMIPMNVLSLMAIAAACMAAWELYRALAWNVKEERA